MSESLPSKARRPGALRTWLGLGLFGAGAILTLDCALTSQHLEEKGDALGRADDAYFASFGKPGVREAVTVFVEKTSGEKSANLVRLGYVMPQVDGEGLAGGCRESLPAGDVVTPAYCDELGDARDTYIAASQDFEASMPGASDLIELGFGGAGVVFGAAALASGLHAGKKVIS